MSKRPVSKGRPASTSDIDWHDRFFEMERKYLELKTLTNEKENAQRLRNVEAQRAKARAARGKEPIKRAEGAPYAEASSSRPQSARPASAPKKRPPALQPTNWSQSVASDSRTVNTATSATNVSQGSYSNASTSPMKRSMTHTASSPYRQLTRTTSTSPQKGRPGSRPTTPGPKSSNPNPNQHHYGASNYIPAWDDDDQRPLPNRENEGATRKLQDVTYVPAAGGSDKGPIPPDPMMVWGVEDHLVQHIQSNALLEMNQQLRKKVDEADSIIKELQHDISVTRNAKKQLQSNLDESRSESHQLVRERDLSVQKLNNAVHQVKLLQEQQQAADGEREQLRFQLEAQLKELRAKLVFGSDNQDALSRDVRTLLQEVKEKNSSIAVLESKLRLQESNLIQVRNANENMLREMENLNMQLGNERKRLLAATRDNHVTELHRRRVEELEQQLAVVQRDKAAFEAEHIRMLDSLMHVSATAQDKAVEEVSGRLKELEEAATHWERVAQLQYRDIAQKVDAHRLCRDECNEAKGARDEAETIAKTLRAELLMSNAKLDVVWPSHRLDAKGIPAEKIAAAFDKVKTAINGGGSYRSRRMRPTPHEFGLELDGELTAEEQLMELEEVNAALIADLEQQRLSNELLAEQLKDAQKASNVRYDDLTKKFAANEGDLTTSHQVIAKQTNRIRFLEEQVRSIRGRGVDNNVSLESVGTNETVFEVFVGQLLPSDAALRHLEDSTTPPPVLFLIIDFLMHEPVSTPTRIGFSCFFDTTSSFQVAMDPLLVYYLQTRSISIQLCQVRGDPTGAEQTYSTEYDVIAEGVSTLEELLGQEQLESKRPSMQGCVSLHAVYSTAQAKASNKSRGFAENTHVANIEMSIVSRVAFTSDVRLAASKPPTPEDLDESYGTLVGAQSANVSTTSTTQGGVNTSSASIRRSPKDVLALEAVQLITLSVRHIKIDYTQPILPLLASFYFLKALGDDCDKWILPNVSAEPRHDFTYHDPDTVATAAFPVRSVQNLLNLITEGWCIFFFDELTEHFTTTETYWGVSSIPLRETLLQLAEELSAKKSSASINGGAVTAGPMTHKAFIRNGHRDRCGEVSVEISVSTKKIDEKEFAKLHEPKEEGKQKTPDEEKDEKAEKNVKVISTAVASAPLSTAPKKSSSLPPFSGVVKPEDTDKKVAESGRKQPIAAPAALVSPAKQPAAVTVPPKKMPAAPSQAPSQPTSTPASKKSPPAEQGSQSNTAATTPTDTNATSPNVKSPVAAARPQEGAKSPVKQIAPKIVSPVKVAAPSPTGPAATTPAPVVEQQQPSKQESSEEGEAAASAGAQRPAKTPLKVYQKKSTKVPVGKNTPPRQPSKAPAGPKPWQRKAPPGGAASGGQEVVIEVAVPPPRKTPVAAPTTEPVAEKPAEEPTPAAPTVPSAPSAESVAEASPSSAEPVAPAQTAPTTSAPPAAPAAPTAPSPPATPSAPKTSVDETPVPQPSEQPPSTPTNDNDAPQPQRPAKTPLKVYQKKSTKVPVGKNTPPRQPSKAPAGRKPWQRKAPPGGAASGGQEVVIEVAVPPPRKTPVAAPAPEPPQTTPVPLLAAAPKAGVSVPTQPPSGARPNTSPRQAPPTSAPTGSEVPPSTPQPPVASTPPKSANEQPSPRATPPAGPPPSKGVSPAATPAQSASSLDLEMMQKQMP